jgi:hypothetical protein
VIEIFQLATKIVLGDSFYSGVIEIFMFGYLYHGGDTHYQVLMAPWQK